jgi:FkbH-like protein
MPYMTTDADLSRELLLHREAIANDFQGDEFLVVPGESQRDRISGELYFLSHHLAQRAEYGDFLLGEKARALRAHNPSGDSKRSAELLLGERSALIATARRFLPGSHVEALDLAYHEFFRPLLDPAVIRVRALFVGDCLGREIQGFLYAACRKRGLELEFIHVGGKTEHLIREAVRGCDHEQYDLIFYSPVTHESIPEFSRAATQPVISPGALRHAVHSAITQTIANVEWLRQYFPAPPILVHNTALMMREYADNLQVGLFPRVKQQLKRALTLPVRRSAAARFNSLLDEYITSQPAELQIHQLDERGLVARVGEAQLRDVLYDVPDIHPTRLGQHLAELYASFIAAWQLRTKKVFVTDLDNTLWNGIIGEGAVTQHHDRQLALKTLRGKGYLLAVSSKNDAMNVRWHGTHLGEGDFVAHRIDWKPKEGNIRSIAAELNLKLKDFAFIDDSPVERALVQQGIPELTVLDATDPNTWQSLALLGRLTPPPDEMDRTKMYLERKNRTEYLEPATDDPERHRAALAGLGLSARISYADARTAARISELVNRTNQFNVTGCRVTETLIRKRVGDPLRPVLCANVRDRFGDCGLVSAAVLRMDETSLEIEAFVLSCRVFGFGIETALMNAIKRHAHATQQSAIVARLVMTQHNKPCHNFLRDHGFRLEGDLWRCDNFATMADPEWLAVTLHQNVAPALLPMGQLI